MIFFGINEEATPRRVSDGTGRYTGEPRIRAEAARRLRDLHGYIGNTIAGVPI